MGTKALFPFYNPWNGSVRRAEGADAIKPQGLLKEANMHERPICRFMPCLVGAAFLALMAAPEPAAAKIKCQGIFQITKHGAISTPYCQELEIARVARSYGWKVTDAQVRNDPLKKVYICQALGGDVRLKGACGAYAPDQYR